MNPVDYVVFIKPFIEKKIEKFQLSQKYFKQQDI